MSWVVLVVVVSSVKKTAKVELRSGRGYAPEWRRASAAAPSVATSRRTSAGGRGVHSSTFQVILSRFGH